MALNCDNLEGIGKDCLNSFGGLDVLLVIDREAITGVTVSAGTVTSISVAGGEEFHQFSFTRDSSNFEETLEVDIAAGTTVFNQSVNLMFKRREVSKRNSLMLLAAGQRDLTMLIKDNNGEHHLYGFNEGMDRGLQLTAMEGGSGTAPTDMSGYSPSFTGSFKEMAYHVDPSIIAGLPVA